MQSNEWWLNGDNFSQSLGCAPLNAVQSAVGILRITQGPFHTAAPQPVIPSLYSCKGLLLPRCRALHLSLKVIGFPSAHSSILSRSLWTATLPLSISTGPPQFGVICKPDESALPALVIHILKVTVLPAGGNVYISFLTWILQRNILCNCYMQCIHHNRM